ncbi:MAG: hypothetical protein HF978_06425 [Desulfobacteraceae bacterium]|nr:hypothetical protein [Desulfobacteraceae bacterium]MBC2755166.1 hypothetical protein [Desulfobacteraceae bacterium]
MPYIFITVSGGIIDQVTFYADGLSAVHALSKYSEKMNVERNDAAVYGPNGMIANTKDFLDEEERYVDNTLTVAERLESTNKPLYVIGTQKHNRGYMIVSPDAPSGYAEPAVALSHLGQMRKNYGGHLQLYQAEPVNYPLIGRDALETYNNDYYVEDFEYFMVEEYLK